MRKLSISFEEGFFEKKKIFRKIISWIFRGGIKKLVKP
jgi:hypothetical protein